MADIAAQVSASLDALTREFDTIAHNLANVSTTGYKRRCHSFGDALASQAGTGAATGGEEANGQSFFDFSQGTLKQTGRTLDVGLYGKGFFVIETPEGPLYTRHGVFRTNQNGQIVDAEGRTVAGTAGPLAVPAELDVSQISIGYDGRLNADGAEVGQFRIVDFPDDEDQLVAAGLNCFRAPDDVKPTDVEETVVRQGCQEASNVEMIDELVSMIMVTRTYEANVKLVNVKKDTSNSVIGVAMG